MCSVVGCDSWRRSARRFPLPEDPEKRLEWVQFLFEVNGQRLKESSWTDITVCTEHFTPDCFLHAATGSGALQLKSGAVPLVHVNDYDELEIKQEPVENTDETPAFEALKICHSPASFKEETSSLIASPRSSDGSESSKYDYVQMLQKIENLDVIRKKVGLLQIDSRYVVNEKQLFKLFSSKCPLCRSKVKTEKAVQGLLLVLNQQCVQCKYRREWKNLSSSAVTADEGTTPTERSEVTLETVQTDEEKTRVPEIVHCIGEDSDPMEELDEFSSSQDDVDSGEDWQPEEELFFYDKMRAESDEESTHEDEDDYDDDDDDDDLVPKNSQLCADCGRFFDHRRPHTCEHKIKPYSCNICGKRFVTETAITAHSKIHEESYELPCKYCHVKFKTKADKITHEQVHGSEEKPYKCPECSERFATNKERRIHLEDREWPHSLKCHICGIQFYQTTSIRRHLLVHTGEKPFKCPVCQRGFSQASHLKSHMRLHTGERPYKCQRCDKSFNHNVSLKSHVQRYHSPSSRHEQKKKMKEKESNPGDAQDDGSNRGADLGVVNVEQEKDSLAQMVKVKRTKPKKKTSGRPKGRPRKDSADVLVQEETLQQTDKRKRQKSKNTKSSDEESDELTDDEELVDFVDEHGKAEKVTMRARKSRGRPKASDFDSDFEPTEMKKKRSNSKNSS
ncbi:uncharacterized protein FYW49_007835 [Xenentodon cancila]